MATRPTTQSGYASDSVLGLARMDPLGAQPGELVGRGAEVGVTKALVGQPFGVARAAVVEPEPAPKQPGAEEADHQVMLLHVLPVWYPRRYRYRGRRPGRRFRWYLPHGVAALLNLHTGTFAAGEGVEKPPLPQTRWAMGK